MIETSIDRVQGDNYCIVFTGEKKFINFFQAEDGIRDA